MKVVILAGGKGERLRPFTKGVPKPMIRINKKPLVEHSIDLFKKYGITDIIFTLCYLPQVIEKYFGIGKKFGIQSSYVIEKSEKPLGTAGALTLIEKTLTETLLFAREISFVLVIFKIL